MKFRREAKDVRRGCKVVDLEFPADGDKMELSIRLRANDDAYDCADGLATRHRFAAPVCMPRGQAAGIPV